MLSFKLSLIIFSVLPIDLQCMKNKHNDIKLINEQIEKLNKMGIYIPIKKYRKEKKKLNNH